jgi:hypothetical protein
MPYTIQPAANVMAINERESGTANEIRFTRFTSCIGVLGVVGGQVRGVHLSISDQNQNLFDNAAVGQVVALFAGATQLKLIGQVAYWENPANGVATAYAGLVAQLSIPADDIYQLTDGVYGGKMDGADLEITYQ